jgi:hypothetical protein
MGIKIKPGDLFHRYNHVKETQHEPKFSGKPDPRPFDRDDLYEVIPMLEAVMDELDIQDGLFLERLEELMIFTMPRIITTREDAFDYLTSICKDRLGR